MADEQEDEQGIAEAQRKLREVLRKFVEQKSVWSLHDARQFLRLAGITLEPKHKGAPHGRMRGPRGSEALPSAPIKEGEVYALTLCSWIEKYGDIEMLCSMIEEDDPALKKFL